MELGELVLGRVNLNAYKKTRKGKEGPCPVIEILDSDGSADGEIVVLEVKKSGE